MATGGTAGTENDSRKRKPRRGLVDIDTGRVTRGRILVQRTPAGYVVMGFGGEERFARFAFGDDSDPDPFFAACRRAVASLDARKIADAKRRGILSELADPADPALTRLAVAEALIRAGFNPDEPRDENGRWTNEARDSGESSGGGDAGTALEMPFGFAGFSNAGFAFAEASPETLASLTALGARFAGPASFLGLIFLPASTGEVVEGDLPNRPGVHFRYDSDTGQLTLFSNGDIFYDDHVHGDGLFRDTDGRVIGRLLEGKVVLDEDALPPEAIPQADAQGQRLRTDDEPKLCPAPTPDRKGGKKPRAIAYQDYIGTLMNGAPLGPGLAVSLVNPIRGGTVAFDNCRRSDGTMIEAKGPGYLDMLLRQSEVPWKWVEADFLGQAERQLQAANGRPIEWHFAEKPVADYVRELFRKQGWPITVIHTPMP